MSSAISALQPHPSRDRVPALLVSLPIHREMGDAAGASLSPELLTRPTVRPPAAGRSSSA